MKSQITLSLLAGLLLIASNLGAQTTADTLLQALGQRLDKIEEFHVDALIKVDVDFISIKDREVKMHFKQPDQFTFDAKGLALLPRNGMQLEYMTLIQSDYTAIESGSEVINNRETSIIKIIPESVDSDIVLAQAWVDPELIRIVRMKTFTRKSGSYTIDFTYNQDDQILPDRLVVNFEIKNMVIPSKAMNDLMTEGIRKSDTVPERAQVIVEYSNYQIIEN